MVILGVIILEMDDAADQASGCYEYMPVSEAAAGKYQKTLVELHLGLISRTLTKGIK